MCGRFSSIAIFQVQDAINHMKMVGRIVSTVICEQQTINHSPQGVVYILEDIIKQVVNCQMRLASPCQLSPNALIGNAFAVYGSRYEWY